MDAGSSSFCFGFVVRVIKFETKQLEKCSRNLMDYKQLLCATVIQDFRCGWWPKQLEVTNQMRSYRKEIKHSSSGSFVADPQCNGPHLDAL